MTNVSQFKGTTLEDLGVKTQETFVNLKNITGACHSIINTVIIPPNPKPAWYDPLGKNLEQAKVDARMWIGTLAPEIISEIPTSIIKYNSNFSAVAELVHDIYKEHPTAKGKDNEYVIQVKELVKTLRITIQDDIYVNINNVKGQLLTWSQAIEKDHLALIEGTHSIKKAEQDLRGSIDKINNHITKLRGDIIDYNSAMAKAKIATIAGSATVVLGIALSVFGFGIILIGLGAITAIGGGIAWAVLQKKINNATSTIAKDLAEIETEKGQIVVLQALHKTTTHIVEDIGIAQTNLDTFRAFWDMFYKEIDDVIVELDKAEKGLSIIMQNLFTQTAAKLWERVANNAEDLLKVDFKITEHIESIDPKAA